MYYEFMQKYRKSIAIGAVGFVALMIIWAILIAVDHTGKVPLVVSVVPGDSKVEFNGQSKGNGTQWLKAGVYEVAVKKDGYVTVTRKVNVDDKKEQNVMAVSLLPQSDDAKKWAASHQDDYKKNEAYGAIEAQSDGKYFASQNPITTKLPFTDPYFKIGYITDDAHKSIKLTVETPSPRYRFYAVEKIRQMGYDPTDFIIEFKDFHNPLGES
jgi:hypothetical protein